MCVLTDAELGTVGKAFERAWDNCLKAGLVTRQNLFEMRRLLAARILRCAYYGQKDEWRLARDALSYIHELGLKSLFERSDGRSPNERRDCFPRPMGIKPGSHRGRSVERRRWRTILKSEAPRIAVK